VTEFDGEQAYRALQRRARAERRGTEELLVLLLARFGAGSGSGAPAFCHARIWSTACIVPVEWIRTWRRR
jgi:hypothetical protein